VLALAAVFALARGSIPGASPAFPLKVSADRRYLTDQHGTPFPILGRTAWFVLSLPAADYRTFIDDTVARGFNSIEFHVIDHDPRGYRPPLNGRGDVPFLETVSGRKWDGTSSDDAPDFTTPNEAYWSFVDEFLSYCESRGVAVLMFPAYVGAKGGNQGWMQEITHNGPDRMRAYGKWLATRYRHQANIIWMMGGDMGTSRTPFDGEQTAAEAALLTGITSVVDPRSTLISAEWSTESIATDQLTFGTFMTMNGAYSWTGDVSGQGRRAYAYGEMPSFLLEEPYDEEGRDGNRVNSSASQPVRRFVWWGWLSTIGGYVAGNGYVWPFNPPVWRFHLDTQGSRDLARLNRFIRSIPWWTLVPSGLNGMRTLVVGNGSTPGTPDYIAAAASRDGVLLVAYVPPMHPNSFSIDMRAMARTVRARWFDPTAGIYLTISSDLPNTGIRMFVPPGTNSAGSTDWLLVLDNRAR
jgi:hypothetical protein